ncbi:MAG: UMP kinase [Thiotrichales bacterium 32-46-8]|jgi:uridylate kinase|nr:UMP kinase [Gammaproteobacteria bacterium]OYX07923.1 MAG: UMP kinase [Thiotrichales bacterium 32-46-8]OYY24616.1 MAG: UMP kinase [Thiotrichales bacterium 35-46-9]OYZ08024.1 MAG: UMP kinase [Thiotrichales bacterium 16-46-22]OZA18642.1 MAG: UMP kinase [Thiotrichales bacterium 17-46-47]OZA75229.1 MAG: UMP kinase [Thiotrichales bacterium 39-47-5]OZA97178.1 MAG: UMP kinase [Thiotrichales bacterium 34-46-19]OZB86563.1 MAG: UMP kinase [Thiotrichales bacterium 12-47-6]UCG18389.1 MAG: UMP kinase 
MSVPIKRILLKFSGEALAGSAGFGYDPEVLLGVCRQVAQLAQQGTQVAIVVGGGNLFRGAASVGQGIHRATADQMGMLATMMNGLALRDTLSSLGVNVAVYSGLGVDGALPAFDAFAARQALSEGKVVILPGGTGSPYFTTDTAAALRAAELSCELVLKATKVDGIYTADPKKDPNATRYVRLTYREALEKQLAVMDTAAFVLCQEQSMPIRVFDMFSEGALAAIVRGEDVGTLVTKE